MVEERMSSKCATVRSTPSPRMPLGFKRSSQHLDGGGCDEGWETALGSGTTSRVAAVARPTRRGAAGEPAAVLGGDCGGSVKRGGGDRGRCVTRGGGPLVPGGGRHATEDICPISKAAIGAVSVVCGTRGDRAGSRTGPGHPADRAPAGAGSINDLA